MKVDSIKTVQKLKELQAKAKAGDGRSVIVGYTQSYAIFVHEMRGNKHPVGRAGYLLDVAREMRGELARVVAAAYARTRDTLKSLLVGGLRLQRESQRNCPVDTGALRASAFTRPE